MKEWTGTGCGGDSCSSFIVAFAPAGGQPAAFYLAFKRPDPNTGYSLVGFGLSGDNADVILHGGKTMTVIGEATFAPWSGAR